MRSSGHIWANSSNLHCTSKFLCVRAFRAYFGITLSISLPAWQQLTHTQHHRALHIGSFAWSTPLRSYPAFTKRSCRGYISTASSVLFASRMWKHTQLSFHRSSFFFVHRVTFAHTRPILLRESNCPHVNALALRTLVAPKCIHFMESRPSRISCKPTGTVC